MTRDESDRLQDIKDAIVTIREHLARAEEEPHTRRMQRCCTTHFSSSS